MLGILPFAKFVPIDVVCGCFVGRVDVDSGISDLQAMKSTGCPPWIEPGHAFRVVVRCEKYCASLDYGFLEIADQEHEMWFDRRSGYSLDKFVEEMARKIIWGRTQTLIIWGVDIDSGAEWKLTSNAQFEDMIKSRWHENVVNLAVEVAEKDGSHPVETVGSVVRGGCSAAQATSGVIDADAAGSVEGGGAGGAGGSTGDTCSSPDNAVPTYGNVDWSTLTIIAEAVNDGDMFALVDEDKVFETMGLKEADDRAAAEATKEYAIPVIPNDIQDDMRPAGLPVDDHDPSEPVWDWDRDNPDMSVGIVYPSMHDFRLAARMHAIVHEFELVTEKSDPTRFRGFCRANGCPWLIRVKMQHDASVRVQINTGTHTCASASRVCGTIASQA